MSRRLPVKPSRLPNTTSDEAKTAQSQRAGLVLLDASRKPVYCNAEAVQILAYPMAARDMRSLKASPTARNLFQSLDRGPSPHRGGVMELRSGKRRYTCRVFRLASTPGSQMQPLTAVLLERGGHGAIREGQLAERFNLTRRECQAAQFVLQGLTNKEIAERMNVAPNTVKTFLKLVMIKLGVSTRTGIVGKIFEDPA